MRFLVLHIFLAYVKALPQAVVSASLASRVNVRVDARVSKLEISFFNSTISKSEFSLTGKPYNFTSKNMHNKCKRFKNKFKKLIVSNNNKAKKQQRIPVFAKEEQVSKLEISHFRAVKAVTAI